MVQSRISYHKETTTGHFQGKTIILEKLPPIISPKARDKRKREIEFCKYELRGGSFKEYTDKGYSGKNTDRPMFEMYAEPSTSFGDIARHFAEMGIKIYEKELSRGFISQLLRNPIYAQADLEMYEFFKSQGTVVVNEAADFAGTNGCYLYQGRDVQARKNKHLKDQILVVAPSEGLVSSETWLRCRKKLMANSTFQGGRKAKNT